MKITINLNPEESAGIKALAIEYGVTPEDILQTFASDVTGSLRSGGSDERDYAENWIKRHHLPRLKGDLTPSERRRLERLQSEAYRIRMAEQSAFQAKLARTWPAVGGKAA